MVRARSVKPITYLKTHTAEVVRSVAAEGGPVLITHNGEAAAVVMDVATYDRWQDSLALLKILALGEADVAAGRTVSHRAAARRARAALARAKTGG
jgi:prevent-host-death family protein